LDSADGADAGCDHLYVLHHLGGVFGCSWRWKRRGLLRVARVSQSADCVRAVPGRRILRGCLDGMGHRRPTTLLAHQPLYRARRGTGLSARSGPGGVGADPGTALLGRQLPAGGRVGRRRRTGPGRADGRRLCVEHGRRHRGGARLWRGSHPLDGDPERTAAADGAGRHSGVDFDRSALPRLRPEASESRSGRAAGSRCGRHPSVARS